MAATKLLLDDARTEACGESLNALIYWQQDAPAPGSSVSAPFENVNVLAKFPEGPQAESRHLQVLLTFAS